MFDPSKFTTPKAKPLPVVLLLDISGSMSGEKIKHLNEAVHHMFNTFAQEEQMETEILVSAITFGSEVNLHIPFTKASQAQWQNLSADGLTPMGVALKMAKAMIEDKNTTPSRAYRPTIVLVSDGVPTDDWQQPLEDFIQEGRSSKCDRMAMAIGDDADISVLSRFIEGTPHPLFKAEDAAQIAEFFQKVTMSVTGRTHSKNPNEIPSIIEKSSSKTAPSNDTHKTNKATEEDDGYW